MHSSLVKPNHVSNDESLQGNTSMPSLSVSSDGSASIPSLPMEVSGFAPSLSNYTPSMDPSSPSWITCIRSELDALAVEEARIRSNLPCRPSSASVPSTLHTAKRPEARQLNANLRNLAKPLPLPVYKEPGSRSPSAKARVSPSSRQFTSRGIQCAKADDDISKRTDNRTRRNPLRQQRSIPLHEKKSVGGMNYCDGIQREKAAAEAKQLGYGNLKVSSHEERTPKNRDKQLSIVSNERGQGNSLSLRWVVLTS